MPSFLYILIYGKYNHREGFFSNMTISQIALSPLTWFFFIFGLIMGSFFNVCIYRIPRKIFWQSQRSFCPQCNAKIPWWLNIPVFSYISLRARTQCCKQRIPIFYPLVEFLTGILFVYIYHRFPFINGPLLPKPNIYTLEFIRFSHALIFTSLLLICSVIDMQHMIIPDSISLSMIALSPLVFCLHPELTWKSSLGGVLLGGGVIYLIAWLYILIRGREGIGMGDAKLLAAIGGWLGYESIIPTLLYGSVMGSVAGIILIISSRQLNMQREMPFGPFLALGACIYLIAPFHWIEILGKINQVFSTH